MPAQDLINPPAFSDLSIGPLVMDELRPREKILDLFGRIGFGIDDRVKNEIFDIASRGGEFCTVNAFRNALNDYIIRHDLVDMRK
ncbi:hypothetical protein EON65_13795 [archaeon]|nr:MAG: hypothetical protein EON65_13795 [archaeon]